MSSYYTYYAEGMSDMKQIRWTMYNEISTSNELITGCLPAYDRTVYPNQVLGVVCMDVSIIMGVPEFRKKSDYGASLEMMRADAQTCFRTVHSDDVLERLRAVAAPPTTSTITSTTITSLPRNGTAASA